MVELDCWLYEGITVSEEYGGIASGYLQHTIAMEGSYLWS